MAGVTGREIQMAFAKVTSGSWGVAASVTKGIYFSSSGGLKYDPEIIVDDAFGQYFLGPHDVGNVNAATPSLQAVARYNDYSYIWEALAMGSPATPTISTSVAGQTTSWQHVIDMAANLDGLGLTLAMNMPSRWVEELTTAKVHGFTFEEGAGGLMRQTWKVTGTKPTHISSINIAVTVTGATYPSLNNRIMMKQGVFRLNAQAGGSLASSDALTIEKMKLTYERPMDAPHVYGQDFIMEPADNGFPVIALEATFPRMSTTDSKSLRAAFADGSAWKADWKFLGSYINSTDQYTLLFQYPYLQVTEFEAPVTGANQVKPKVKWDARLPSAAPTGMSGVTNPMRITRIQVNSPVAF